MEKMWKNSHVKSNDTLTCRMYACDFETTTSAWRKDESKVWSFAYDEVGKYEPTIKGSIEEFFEFCSDVQKGINKRLYFHNLKFDGNFILYHLQKVMGFKTILNPVTGIMEQPKNLLNGEMCYVISDVGQWYYIAFRINNVLVEVRDSLKILPFTLKQIGESFCKRFKKTEMNYDDKTSLLDLTEKDIEYIKNDVLVLSEALSFIMQRNNEESPFKPITSLTIGGACLARFKQQNFGQNNLVSIHLNEESIPFDTPFMNADEYIRSAYRGGYCYVNKKIQGKILNKKGFTADVNSLYPYVMCTDYSGSRYPIGHGKFFKGKPSDRDIIDENIYFYLRVNVSFELKKGFIPTIQKKNSFMFIQNCYLESSRVQNYKTGKYEGKPLMIEITFSKDDWILFVKHYNVIKIEYLDYIKFMTANGLFDTYIKDFAKIKMESKGAVRNLAKLFQNNLYGQMAKSDNSTFKILREDSEHDIIDFEQIEAHEKKVVNIAIGAAITAKARYYQITTIQNNKERFCYSDTDSLHCVGNPEDFVGKIDDKIYGAYKIEGVWDKAIFLRQKTYIEQLIIPDGQKRYCENCKNHCNWNICAAGMTPEQKEIFRNKYNFEDFKVGLTIYGGKLKPKLVKGGVLLEEVDFTIR